ncbi:MAG: hypothetical protein Q8881_02760 [Sweet potato little leaf phytoplasma]|nr:hypothetical protein [Sweet potato little leaf phytoplasma]
MHSGRFCRNGRIKPAEFRTRGRFPRNGRINPDEFSPNFARGDVSDETAESIPTNFCRISHSGRFRRNGRTSTKFLPRGRFPRNGRISAEFCSHVRFRRNRRINPAEYRIGDDSDETVEFSPHFALGDVSPKTAESIPPNFCRISHSERFRRNGRINPAEFPPNFALGDVSPETAEFRTRSCFRRNNRISAEFHTHGRFPRNGRISVVFRTRDVSDETAEFPLNFALGDISDKIAESILPNFLLATFHPKWLNFRRISQSGKFPTKPPNQSRRIWH